MCERDSFMPWSKACVLCLTCWACLFGCSVNLIPTRWERLTEDTHAHVIPFLSVSFFNSKTGIAITPLSLERTDDGGKTWVALTPDTTEKSFYSVAFTSSTTGYVVGMQKRGDGDAPMVLRTEDAGTSWQDSSVSFRSLSSKLSPRLHNASFCNQQVGWAVGAGLIVHTSDGGRLWETQRVSDDEVLFGVACLSPERALAVGKDGLILQTRDGGKRWDPVVSGTQDNLLRVRFFGEDGWIVG